MAEIDGGAVVSKFAGLVYYGMRVFVFLSIIFFILRGDFTTAVSAVGILLLMLVPAFLKEQYRVYLPFELDLSVVVFIFLTLFLGSLVDFYEQVLWWDDLLHFLSGILFGMTGFILVYVLNDERLGKMGLTPLFIAVFSVSFSLAMSVVWEIYEYTADSLFGFNMQRSGLQDTMGDLIVNAVASLFVAVSAYLWMVHRKRVPLVPGRLRMKKN